MLSSIKRIYVPHKHLVFWQQGRLRLFARVVKLTLGFATPSNTETFEGSAARSFPFAPGTVYVGSTNKVLTNLPKGTPVMSHEDVIKLFKTFELNEEIKPKQIN